jgi:hypothetical protein
MFQILGTLCTTTQASHTYSKSVVTEIERRRSLLASKVCYGEGYFTLRVIQYSTTSNHM